jgi:carboxylesterase
MGISYLIKKVGIDVIIFILIALFIALYFNSGFIQEQKIDVRDEKLWHYTNGSINGAEAFFINGDDTCWILIHGYTATAQEMRELGVKINKQYNDTVHGILLSGHGTRPSDMAGKSLHDWFDEVDNVYSTLKPACSNINVVGSSFGAALAMKLAEEQQLHRVILVNPFLFTRFRVLFYFSDVLYYAKKAEVAHISNQTGLDKHIAYLNMPLAPIRDSFYYLDKRLENLHGIKEPTLVMHSSNDRVSAFGTAEMIYEEINTTNKEIVWFNESDHVLLMDHDKENVIEKIIEFGGEDFN